MIYLRNITAKNESCKAVCGYQLYKQRIKNFCTAESGHEIQCQGLYFNRNSQARAYLRLPNGKNEMKIKICL